MEEISKEKTILIFLYQHIENIKSAISDLESKLDLTEMDIAVLKHAALKQSKKEHLSN